ncbi:MAG: flagellar brake protein [Lachnospiraceae bacterium]|nr:flagellar brake protein [Lachnospiraceae bacterium]
MIESIFQIGDKIELTDILVKPDKDRRKKIYVSQLLEIVDDRVLNVAVPIESAHFVPLEVGTRYDMRVFTSKGMFTCVATVTGRFKKEGSFFLQMKMLTEIKKDQRRQYFRIDRMIPMHYHVVSREEGVIKNILESREFEDDRERRVLEKKLREVSGEEKTGTINNISAGGARFLTSEKLLKEDLLNIDFYLDPENSDTYFELECKIIYASDIRNQNQKYENRAEFLNVNRADRERIVRFVFTEERKIRKKESGQ